MPKDYGCRGTPQRTYDATGVEVLTVGVQSDGSAGLVARSSASVPLVYVGELPDGTHGIEVLDSSARVLFRVTSESGQTAPYSYAYANPSGNPTLSGSATPFRPGTASGSFSEVWRGDFFSLGPSLDYDLTLFANGGSMDWRLKSYEYYGGDTSTVIASGSETTNVARQGTATIPATALSTGGSDVAGRQMTVRLELRNTGLAATVDATVNSPFRSHT